MRGGKPLTASAPLRARTTGLGATRRSRIKSFPASVADAPPNGDVLAKAIGPMVDDDPAPAAIISIVGIVIAIVVCTRTNANTARTHVKLHGLRRRRTSGR